MSEGGGRRPPSADIVRIGHRYNREGKERGSSFLGALKLAAPSSKDVTYTFYVVDANSKGVLASQAKDGDGEQLVTFELDLDPDAGADIGFYATSGTGDTTYDRMPAEDLVSVNTDNPVDYWWSP